MTSTRKTVEKVVETQVLDIPENELEEYREAFALFDKDGDGQISGKEFLKVLKNLGQKVTPEEGKIIMDELDQDGSGMIDFTEFVSYMKKQKVSEEVEIDPVIKAFQVFDPQRNDAITKKEFRTILTEFGDAFTPEECEEIFEEANLLLNEDPNLYYREFVEFWRNK